MAEKKKKAFILVGHSNWGKSETLAALTDGDRKTNHFGRGELFPNGPLSDKDFYLRRMSNDDKEDSLLKFSERVGDRAWEECLIMTLCPNFENGRRTREILDRIREIYDLYFFVLMRPFRGDGEISPTEILELERYTESEIGRNNGTDEAEIRRAEFTAFIESTRF